MRLTNASPSIAWLLAFALFGLVGVSLTAAAKQEKPNYRPTGSEATIVGTISFLGKPPKPLRIDTSADPVCERVNPDPTTDWVTVANHKLANVVVYVRAESLNSYLFDAPSPDVTLEHKGCRYVPHVLGMQTQQTLKILNSDPTTHNTHPTPKNNREWNQSQPPGAIAIEQRFAWPELFIPIKDNQHPWEKAYVGVFSHPFFSVSSTDGSYRISGLPPGQYTVVAWHERLGEQTTDVFLAGSEQKELDLVFKTSDQ
jgi:hypothetical protein